MAGMVSESLAIVLYFTAGYLFFNAVFGSITTFGPLSGYIGGGYASLVIALTLPYQLVFNFLFTQFPPFNNIPLIAVGQVTSVIFGVLGAAFVVFAYEESEKGEQG